MSGTRPDIELTLDVRSYERVVVLSDPAVEVPETWIRPSRDLSQVGPETVVVVDRVDVSRRTLALIAERGPRLVALIPHDVEQEKVMRRAVTSLFPWSEVWTFTTSSGKALVASIHGRPYDRNEVPGMGLEA